MNDFSSLNELSNVKAVYRNYNEYVVVISKDLDNYDEILDTLINNCGVDENSKINICEEVFLNRGMDQLTTEEFIIDKGEQLYSNTLASN